jgi:DNA-binding NarL/FixJ family response regulator
VAPDELVRAVDKIAAGESHFGLPETARYLRRYRAAPSCALAEPVTALTTREREVITLISAGLTNQQISRRLRVAVRTIETHRERVMRKLDINDVGALRFYAAAQGLIGRARTGSPKVGRRAYPWENDPTEV